MWVFCRLVRYWEYLWEKEEILNPVIVRGMNGDVVQIRVNFCAFVCECSRSNLSVAKEHVLFIILSKIRI